MECPICMNLFDLKFHTALKLRCYHNLCYDCCQKQIKLSNEVVCPQCSRKSSSKVLEKSSQTIKRLVNITQGSLKLDNNCNETLRVNSKITVLVRNSRNQFIELEINSNSTVIDLKKQICLIERIDTDSQILLHNGLSLQNDKSLNECGVVNNSIIYIVFRTSGG